ncbi:glycosyl hydrolase family 28-related protein [Luteimicrobium subarcticum]|uniref:ASPM-SPD-2-Hydin domain-containing protein n=1 Tax=Luteimicrobium subarcticum TaxID=620910 RepID=A0A2M8WT42_9MICO|nr:glycosyl hydrolase family 28-related protein [Luteimicrobium subarcticum]PJI94006.1 ASPM-SPD-2-Hydin domain-containing protein [Luteimicrobium subarcticum]
MRTSLPRATPRATLALLAATTLSLAATLPASAAGAALAARPAPALLPTPTSVPGTALPTLAGATLPSAPGARVPFVEHEAESARTDGTVLAASRAFTTVAAEASGRRAVRLAAGQHVDIVLARPANALDVRYSVPDGTTSTLAVSADGRAVTSLPLTSRYAWAYGNYPFTNDPADGGPHHVFDDAHALLGRTLPAGTTLRLAATSDGTVVDLADLELVGAPTASPAGFLDARTFGADPTGATDSGAAIQTALDAASARGTGVWLAPGTYAVTRHLVVDQVSLAGAGPWYTTLRGAGVGVYGAASPATSTGVHLSGFTIQGDTTVRDDATSDSGLGGSMGGGSTVDDVWIEHTKVGAWFDGPSSGLTLTHLRVQDTWADGINLHGGVSDTTLRDVFVRGTGDDGVALWSDQRADHGDTVDHVTVSSPVLANGFGLYGGHDNAVTHSVAADTVTQGAGIEIGNRFGSVPLSGTTTASGNLFLRTGGLVPNAPTQIGAVWVWADDAPITGKVVVSDSVLADSSFAGVQVDGSSVTGLSVSRVAVAKAGSSALQLSAAGSGTFSSVVATGLGTVGVEDCASGFVVRRTGLNLGWSSSRCGLPAAGQLVLDQPDGVGFGFQSLGSTTTRTLTITNPGPEPVTVQQVLPPAGFTVTHGCATIAVGGACELGLAFAPTASKNYSGLVTVDSTSPAGPYVVMLTGVGFDPDGDLALGRATTATSQVNDWYGPAKLVDGDAGSGNGYWESDNAAGLPQSATVDLGQTTTVRRVVLSLPPSWGVRDQTITVSADGVPVAGVTSTALRDPAQPDRYTFDSGVDDDAVTLTFPAVEAQHLTFTVSSNTGSAGAQLSEIAVYAH